VYRLNPLAAAADLSVTLTATPLPGIAGQPLVYTVSDGPPQSIDSAQQQAKKPPIFRLKVCFSGLKTLF